MGRTEAHKEYPLIRCNEMSGVLATRAGFRL